MAFRQPEETGEAGEASGPPAPALFQALRPKRKAQPRGKSSREASPQSRWPWGVAGTLGGCPRPLPGLRVTWRPCCFVAASWVPCPCESRRRHRYFRPLKSNTGNTGRRSEEQRSSRKLASQRLGRKGSRAKAPCPRARLLPCCPLCPHPQRTGRRSAVRP